MPNLERFFKNKAVVLIFIGFLIGAAFSPFFASAFTIKFGTDASDVEWGIFNIIRNSEGNVWEATGANIQVAIDDLTDGGKVWLPEGDFVITTTISLVSNLTLVGSGMYTTRIVQTTDDTNVVECEGSVANRKHNITIMDMTLEMDTSGTLGQTLWFDRTDGFIAKHLFLENAEYDAFLVEESTDGMILNCIANGSGDDGFNIYSNSGQISLLSCIARNIIHDGIHISVDAAETTIASCISYNNGQSGLKLHAASRCVINGNVFINNTKDGIYIWGDSSDSVISSNFIQGNEEAGIYLQNGPCNITINSNTIKNESGYGIYATGAVANCSIIGNMISDTSSHAISLNGRDWIVDSNTILDSGNIGINIPDGAQYITVTNNHIANPTDDGIRIAGLDSFSTISGNCIHNPDDRGIYIVTASFIICEGNTIQSANNDPSIHSEYGNDIIIDNNMISDGEYGIWIGGSNNICIGNKIDTMSLDGITILSSASYNVVSSNIITNSRHEIEINTGANNNTIMGNICDAIIEEGTADYNLITGNNVVSLTIVGSDTFYTGNIGYMTIFPTTNMTNVQAGFAWFDTATDQLNVYNGASWVSTTLA